MTAIMIPFPSRRLIGKARHTVSTYLATIDRCPGSAGSYYRRVEGGLAVALERAGIERGRIDQEVVSFRRLFVEELRRQAAISAEDVGAQA